MKKLKSLVVRATAVALLACPWAVIAQNVPAIVLAASQGKTATVTALLEKGASPDTRQPDGRTALILAADNGHFDTVRTLMIHGAHKELTDPTGRTAFDYALEKKHVDIVALLRDAS